VGAFGFFAPWFLAGLAALAVPIYFHLLRQHKQTPRAFASLMFFERRIQSSVKHRRLKHYALLALRLAMLALLALLFANPFINRSAPAATGRKMTLIAVDRSFSMRYADHLARAQQQAIHLIGGLRAGDRAQVVAVSDHIEQLTQPTADKATLVSAVRSITASDAASSYAEFARFLRALPQSAGMPVEAHLFSDLQKTSLPPSFADLRLDPRVSLNLYGVGGGDQPNWTVETVTAPHRVYGVRKADVQATIAGYGAPAARRTARLVLDGRTLAAKPVEIPANGRAVVQFQNIEAPYGFSRGEVQIDGGDRLPDDDRFYFVLERTDPGKALFIHDARQTPDYFRAALEAASGAAFNLETMTPERSSSQALDGYAFIVLSGVGEMPAALAANLRSYVNNGGGVLVALGPATAAAGRVPILGDSITASRYSSRQGNRFEAAGRVDSAYPPVAKASGFEGVKFYQVMRVDPRDARIAARLGDGAPLIYEKRVGEGRVMVFTSTLDNVSNDLPLHASFIPFVEAAAQYLEGVGAQPGAATVGSYIELRSAKDQGVAAEVIAPDGRRAMDLRQAASAQNFRFEQAGFYDVRPATGRRELIAVNVDRREADLTPIPEDALALWRGSASQETRIPGAAAAEPQPYLLWKYILLALLVIAVAESAVADRFTSATKENIEMPVEHQPEAAERDRVAVGGEQR
jgi:hypothetical protein